MSEALGTCPNCKKRPYYEDTRICACGYNLQPEIDRVLAVRGRKPPEAGSAVHGHHVPWERGRDDGGPDKDAAAMVSGVVLSSATGRPVAGAMVVMSIGDEVIARLATSPFGEFRHFFGRPHAEARTIRFEVEHQGYDRLVHDAKFEGRPLQVELLLAGKSKAEQPAPPAPKPGGGTPAPSPPAPPVPGSPGAQLWAFIAANWKPIVAVLVVLLLVALLWPRSAKGQPSATPVDQKRLALVA